jgi:hypothetical protein
VVLGSMGMLAAALSACGSDPDKRCVDRDSYQQDKGYKIVDTVECGTTTAAARTALDGAWYYDPDVSGNWADDGTFQQGSVTTGGLGGGGTSSNHGSGGHKSSGG